MFGHFYNQGMRKMTVAFGQVFNNIQIKRTGSDSTIQSIRVPLAYAPKEKFLVRLDQQPNLEDRQFAVTLPRMGFEISGIEYDGSRKLTKVQKFKTTKTNTGVMNFNYMPVPYNISYNLYCFTATAEGGLQIVEQILPYFQPDYTVTINVVPEMGIKRDVPIVLNNINYEDSYSGDFESRRAVIYTLNFTAKTYLYGPASTQKVIRETQADMHTDLPAATREERITVVPNPESADADDDFGFTTTISFFQDSKNYDKNRDEDV
jgi:hypothetical protein|tara:strand:+ start:648 stop:1436 length:789 start_codon:yes stop_codon:yes gene_type:complete